jgi:hypothetical protein
MSQNTGEKSQLDSVFDVLGFATQAPLTSFIGECGLERLFMWKYNASTFMRCFSFRNVVPDFFVGLIFVSRGAYYRRHRSIRYSEETSFWKVSRCKNLHYF